MAQKLTDYQVFLREFRATFSTTGAVLPTGGAASRAMSRFVAEDWPQGRSPEANGTAANGSSAKGPRQLLEVGPGTGAITDHVIRRMRPGDQLTLVELNERFVNVLRGRLEKDARWQGVASRVSLFAGSLEDLPRDKKYDVVVSALPFNNFQPDLVRRLLADLVSRLAPHGTLTFIEYIAIRRFKELLASSAERQRLNEVGGIINEFVAQHAFDRDMVLANVPPAWVHHVSHAKNGNGAHHGASVSNGVGSHA
jgi:phospholipid N-methyltransferase